MAGVISTQEKSGSRGATPPGAAADAMRRAGPAELAAALEASRAALLALFDGFERALGPGGLHIARDTVVNLPLWELGHIGWFEEVWLSRNPLRLRGAACAADVPRGAPFRPGADRLYDSSNVPHATRWSLALPDADATRRDLAVIRERTLRLLDSAPHDDAALYFFRLVLFHEDMHREAWRLIAQRLGLDLGVPIASPRPAGVDGEWTLDADTHPIGGPDNGFAFDNERPPRLQPLPTFTIDRAPVTWRRFLPFVEAGGYGDDRLWSDAGRAWRDEVAATHPLHLRRLSDHDHDGDGAWQQQRFGRWQPLDLDTPALHLSAHEAEAWCRWAGRRLPTEFEWEAAARAAPAAGEAFVWGEVWEWTASPFAPYDGFVAHPYRDYSQPWFDGRPVLRGGSFATAPHLKHPAYRNFYPADRRDLFAGFRSAAV